jgi:stearoyl-CoA desaturase (delta-9 desaturase)
MNTVAKTGTDDTRVTREHRLSVGKSVPFFLVHLAAVVGVWRLGFSWKGVALAVALYYVRMFGVTAGYHRYFSHRSYRTSRAFQLVLALLAQSSSQKGAIWWASHHRLHHKKSDQPGDVHSAKLEGLWWSHVGWILSDDYDATDWDRVRDLQKYPELVWLNRHWWVPPTVLGVGSFLVGGWFGFTWGFLVSTVLLWHGTFTINSLSHLLGRRRYATTDDSRNNWLLAIVTIGEGWHNNHHHYQRACSQGFYWYEVDLTFLVLRAFSAVGLVHDLHTVPRHVREDHATLSARSAGSVSAKALEQLSPVAAIAPALPTSPSP